MTNSVCWKYMYDYCSYCPPSQKLAHQNVYPNFFFYNICFRNCNIILYIQIHYILWLLSRQGDTLLAHRQGGCNVLSYLYEYFFKKTIMFKQNDTECVSCTIHAYNILNDKVTYFLR